MFTLNRLGAVWSVVLIGAVMSAACGDSKSSMNPVAPSAVVIGAQAQEADGAEGGESSTTGGPRNNNGNGNGNGNNGGGNGNGNSGGGNGNGNSGGGNDNGNSGGGNGNGNTGGGNGNGNTQPTVPGGGQTPTNTSPTSPSSRKVELQGAITAKSGDSLTVRGQQVVVPATCVIRHGQTQYQFSDLKVGDLVHVRASMSTSTGATSSLVPTTTLTATEVMLQNPGFAPGGDDGDDDDTSDSLVSVTASDDTADESGTNPGAFRLTRTGTSTALASSLTVSYTLTGTAVNGTDYQTTLLSATFGANQATIDIPVTPLTDTTSEGSESVILTLTTVPAPYALGSPSIATVVITDTSSPLVTVTAFDSSAAETGGDLGTFRVTRTGSTASALTVTFTVSGTATAGTDYQSLPASVTIPAGASSADVFVIALPDGDSAEGSETVIITVTDGASYDVGASPSATVTIAG